MASWQGSVSTSGETEKTYKSSEFRSNWAADCPDVNPKRHKFDCELAAAIAAYTPGPRMSADTIKGIAKLMSHGDNVHLYPSKDSNDGNDKDAAKALMKAYLHQTVVSLPPHQAAHIRAGGEWLASHKHELPPGFINTAKKMYHYVQDTEGHQVVDGRMFN